MKTGIIILIMLQIVLCIFSVISTGSGDGASGSALDRIHQALQASQPQPSSTTGSWNEADGRYLVEDYSNPNPQPQSSGTATVSTLTSSNTNLLKKVDIDVQWPKMTWYSPSETLYIPYKLTWLGTDGILGAYNTGATFYVKMVVLPESNNPYTASNNLVYPYEQLNTEHCFSIYGKGTEKECGLLSGHSFRIPLNNFKEGTHTIDIHVYGTEAYGALSNPLGYQTSWVFTVSNGRPPSSEPEPQTPEQQCAAQGNIYRNGQCMSNDQARCIDNGYSWEGGQCINRHPSPQSSNPAQQTPEQQCQAAGGTMQNGQCITPQVEELKRQAQCIRSGGTWVPQPNFNGYCQSQPTPEQQCQASGGVFQNGQCVQQTPQQACFAKGMIYKDGQCITLDQLVQQAKQQCEAQGGTIQNGQCISPAPADVTPTGPSLVPAQNVAIL